MPRQLKYNQAIAKAFISNADGIIEAIDKYLAKADDELSDVLADEGYADAEDSVKVINAMQEEIAETLQNQTDDLVEALAAEQDSGWLRRRKKYLKCLTEMILRNRFRKPLQICSKQRFLSWQRFICRKQTETWLLMSSGREQKAGLPHGANGWDS